MLTANGWQYILRRFTHLLYNKSQLTQMDPRNALPHAKSTIALYTEQDVQLDEQMTVDSAWSRPPSPNIVNDKPTAVDRLSHSALYLRKFTCDLPIESYVAEPELMYVPVWQPIFTPYDSYPGVKTS